jgi:hypothetical protein
VKRREVIALLGGAAACIVARPLSRYKHLCPFFEVKAAIAVAVR